MENVVTYEIIPTTENEKTNLMLIEAYNNLLYDTQCKLFEYVGEVDVRDMCEYNYTIDLIKELEPKLSDVEAKKVYEIIVDFEVRIQILCGKIKLQVLKGAMNENALEIIREWERFPSTFPLN